MYQDARAIRAIIFTRPTTIALQESQSVTAQTWVQFVKQFPLSVRAKGMLPASAYRKITTNPNRQEQSMANEKQHQTRKVESGCWYSVRR